MRNLSLDNIERLALAMNVRVDELLQPVQVQALDSSGPAAWEP